jgi:hypothetical protein
VVGHAAEEDGVRGDRLAVVLEGHGLLVHGWGRMKRALSPVVRKIS